MFDINKKIQIGNLKLDFPFFLAPMAGVTDYAFRVIAKEFGAGVVYSEFVSAHGIIRKNEKTLNMIKFSEFERPIGIQIFGDTPEVMENAAKLVYEKFKPDLIDINYGCPVPKVTKKGAGSAALKDLCLMEDITEAVVKAVDKIPVTVKMRAGWNSENIVSTQAGINLEKVGVLSGIFALIIGSFFGISAAFFGGRYESIIMRIVDIQLSFPSILVALIILAAFGKGVEKTIIALILVQWAYYARTARSSALVEINKEYVDAARCLAFGNTRIMFKHILPNCMAPLIVVGFYALSTLSKQFFVKKLNLL